MEICCEHLSSSAAFTDSRTQLVASLFHHQNPSKSWSSKTTALTSQTSLVLSFANFYLGVYKTKYCAAFPPPQYYSCHHLHSASPLKFPRGKKNNSGELSQPSEFTLYFTAFLGHLIEKFNLWLWEMNSFLRIGHQQVAAYRKDAASEIFMLFAALSCYFTLDLQGWHPKIEAKI